MSEHQKVEVHALPPGFRRTGVQRTDNEDLNNSGDILSHVLEDKRAKLVWHFRHGQSTGNAARVRALAADAGTGKHIHEDRYHKSQEYADTALTDLGKQQACHTAALVTAWAVKPTLVVCSALTRAIQTAAILFGQDLAKGSVRLIIRPEMREFWPDNVENRGRTRQELRSCPLLQDLSAWEFVKEALSDKATAEWGEKWDTELAASEGQWQAHCGGGERICVFREWLASQPDQCIAVVSHIGAINNLLNREPWTQAEEVCGQRTYIPTWLPASGWPAGGISRRFGVPNAGWVAVAMTTNPNPQTSTILRVRGNLHKELARLKDQHCSLLLALGSRRGVD